MRILPYKKGLSSTAELVGQGIGTLYGTSRPRRRSVVHSWGAGVVPRWANRVSWVNHPAATKIVANKADWAKFCSNASVSVLRDAPDVSRYCLQYTTCKRQAQAWAAVKGNKVVCRTILNGSCGRGIVIARNADQVVDARLYSLYFNKTSEYRIVYAHQFGEVFTWSKRKPDGVEMSRDEQLIRTLDSGYVYQREYIHNIPAEVYRTINQVALGLNPLGLKLLAYDVVYNAENDTAAVVEANTAPGLNDDTASCVAAVLREYERTIKQGKWK